MSGSAQPGDAPTLREQMRSTHREILRRTFLGDASDAIAGSVGLTTSSVRFIQRSPLFQAALAELQREADAKVVDTAQRMRVERDLINAAEEGVPIARTAMHNAVNPMVKARIAFGFLDRAGFNPGIAARKDDPDNYRQIIERLDEMERGVTPVPRVEFTERKVTVTGSPAQTQTPGATPPSAPPQRVAQPLEILLRQLHDDHKPASASE